MGSRNGRRSESAGGLEFRIPMSLRISAAGGLVLAVVAAACAGLVDKPVSSAPTAADPTPVPISPSSTTTAAPTTTTAAPTTTTAAPTTTTTTAPAGAPALALKPVASLTQPIAMRPIPGTEDLLVAQKSGEIRRLRRAADGTFTVDDPPVLTVAVSNGNEQGLLGIAVPPAGDALYVSYTDPNGDSVIAGYDMVAGVPDAASVRVILTEDQPAGNHNGGDIHIGPDGMLYIAFGDGGGGNDQYNNAQDRSTSKGSILRVSPTAAGFDVPADNPFVGAAGVLPETYLYGVRNPWRISFDSATDDLWIADVGQSTTEEINMLSEPSGVNLGWPAFEGTRAARDDVTAPGAVPPLFEYDHAVRGCSVTGGYVYRGAALAGLVGAYLYTDYCSPGIRALMAPAAAGAGVTDVDLGISQAGVGSFGQDAAGELYVLSLTEGAILRIEAAA